jgi:hypothetical protein
MHGGRHARKDAQGNHGAELAKALDALLAAKTRAGYGYQAVNSQTRTRCRRAAERLVRAAGDRLNAL